MNLIIRPFQSSDQEAVRQLVMRNLGEHFTEVDPLLNPDLDDISRNYIERGDLFIVAQKNGEIVGSGSLVKESVDTGRIVRLSVSSKYRRLGIGQRIVEYLIDKGHQKGFRLIVVETNLDWLAAIALYKKIGFQEYDRDEECIHLSLS